MLSCVPSVEMIVPIRSEANSPCAMALMASMKYRCRYFLILLSCFAVVSSMLHSILSVWAPAEAARLFAAHSCARAEPMYTAQERIYIDYVAACRRPFLLVRTPPGDSRLLRSSEPAHRGTLPGCRLGYGCKHTTIRRFFQLVDSTIHIRAARHFTGIIPVWYNYIIKSECGGVR